jgi:Clr5 domain
VTPSSQPRAGHFAATMPSQTANPSFTTSELSLAKPQPDSSSYEAESFTTIRPVRPLPAESRESNIVTGETSHHKRDLFSDNIHSFVMGPGQQPRLILCPTSLHEDSSHGDNDATLRPPSNPPTAQDWENHRKLFTKIYRDQGRTLKKAKAVMEDQYSFIAT